MTEPVTVEAWLRGGPDDGAMRDVEVSKDGQPPELVAWHSGEVYVGSSDQPAPPALATYRRTAWSGELGLWVYGHVGTLGG